MLSVEPRPGAIAWGSVGFGGGAPEVIFVQLQGGNRFFKAGGFFIQFDAHFRCAGEVGGESEADDACSCCYAAQEPIEASPGCQS